MEKGFPSTDFDLGVIIYQSLLSSTNLEAFNNFTTAVDNTFLYTSKRNHRFSTVPCILFDGLTTALGLTKAALGLARVRS